MVQKGGQQRKFSKESMRSNSYISKLIVCQVLFCFVELQTLGGIYLLMKAHSRQIVFFFNLMKLKILSLLH